MKYFAHKKIGMRGRQWHIVNELGGLIEEFTGTKIQAIDRAFDIEQQRNGQMCDCAGYAPPKEGKL